MFALRALPFLFVLFPSSAFAEGKVSFDKYQDKDKGFSISYPRGWEKQIGAMGAQIIVLSPQEGAKDAFRENLNVVVEELNTKMNTKDYYAATQTVLKKVFSEYKVEKNGTKKINGKEFYWAVFSHRLGSVKARVLQHMTVNGNRAYVVTASAAPDAFEKYRSVFEGAMNGFEINEVRSITKKK